MYGFGDHPAPAFPRNRTLPAPRPPVRGEATVIVRRVAEPHSWTAVLLDVSEYEAMLQKIELLQDVAHGEVQIDGGQGIPHRRALELALERIGE